MGGSCHTISQLKKLVLIPAVIMSTSEGSNKSEFTYFIDFPRYSAHFEVNNLEKQVQPIGYHYHHHLRQLLLLFTFKLRFGCTCTDRNESGEKEKKGKEW